MSNRSTGSESTGSESTERHSNSVVENIGSPKTPLQPLPSNKPHRSNSRPIPNTLPRASPDKGANNEASSTVSKVSSDQHQEVDCLESSLNMLKSSLESAKKSEVGRMMESCGQVEGFQSTDNNQVSNTDPSNAEPTPGSPRAWWVDMVRRMEERHVDEKVAIEKTLESSNITPESKENVRRALTERLHALEEQLVESAKSPKGSTAANEFHRGKESLVVTHSLSNVSTVTGNTGVASSVSTSDGENESTVKQDPPAASSQNLVQLLGVVKSPAPDPETTTLEPNMTAISHADIGARDTQSLELLQDLEKKLTLAVNQHEKERQEWVARLEEAASVTAKGERLSVQQQEELLVLQEEVTANQRRQRKQWKEKVKVLQELLQLTEQQHDTEKLEWLSDKDVLENTITQLTADKAELKVQAETAKKQASKLHEHLRELEYTSPADRGSRSSQTPPRSSVRSMSPLRIEWDDKLDRAMIERDMYFQEVERAKQTLRTEREIWKKEKARLQNDLASKDMKWEKELTARELYWNDQRLINEEEWKEELEKKLQELRDRHKAEAKDKKDSDEDLLVKYRELMEKRNELVGRVRKLEEQRATEKGAWKLQLEAALADARHSAEQVKVLEEQLRKKESGSFTDEGQAKPENSSLKVQLETAAEEHRRLTEEVQQLQSELAEVRSEHDEQVLLLQVEAEERVNELKQEFQTKMTKLAKEHAASEERMKVELKTSKANAQSRLAQVIDSMSEDPSSAANTAPIAPDLTKRKARSPTRRENADFTDKSRASLVKKHDEGKRQLQRKFKSAQDETEKKLHERTQLLKKRDETIRSLEKELKLVNENADRQRTEHVRLLKKLEEEKKELESQAKVVKSPTRTSKIPTSRSPKQNSPKSPKQLQSSQQVAELKAKYLQETEVLSSQLKKCQDENRVMAERTNTLASSLEELTTVHSLTKQELESQLQTTREERDRCLSELNSLRQESEPARATEYNQEVSLAIESMREDVLSIREAIENRTDEVDSKENACSLRADLSKVQASLAETMSLLALHKTLMQDGRQPVEQAAGEAIEISAGSFDRAVLAEVRQLSQHVTAQLQARPAFTNDEETALLSKELKHKESMMDVLKEQLERLQGETEAEIARREVAEKEVATLNDQADAYSEEIMRLSARIADLEECMPQDVLPKAPSDEIYENNAPQNTSATQDVAEEDDSPMLEEALALAQGLTDVVHGRGDYDKETSVMEMLETLSDLMEKHERGDSGGTFDPALDNMSPASSNDLDSTENCSTPKNRHQFYNAGESVEIVQRRDSEEKVLSAESERDAPPLPVETPLHPHGGERVHASLEVVVEQLYSRCQLLERERMEMMESTIDILESAREASHAEVEAAAATARRKAAEEMMKIRRQTQADRERLYHKLCTTCASGLIASS